MKTTFLYTLNSPVTGAIRYLGKSDNPFKRFKKHLCQAKRGKTHKNHWILSLQAQELKPWMELLDEVPVTEWQFWEREYIRVFRAINIRLTNGTAGGDGHTMRGAAHPMFGKVGASHPAFGHRHTLEARSKMGKSGSSHPMFGKTGNQTSMFGRSGEKAPMYGRAHTLESRNKMCVAAKGKQAGEKNSNFGKQVSDTTRSRISKALSGRKFSAEHCATLSAARIAFLRKDQ